jgi:lipid-A-disaccharide synthase-like uncharacterized protein
VTAATYENVWMGVGFLAQGVFTARFLVQWAVSEKRRDSVVPVAFWWISLSGGVLLLAYAVHKQDPPIILGQAMGLVVYVRNLMLVSRARRRAARRAARSATGHAAARRPHRIDAPEHGSMKI